MDALLRARLRIPHGADLRLKTLRLGMSTVDLWTRGLTGQAFFALREAEEVLRILDGRQGPELIETVLGLNGGTTIHPQGLEHVPTQGAVVIGSTHPIGTFDFLSHAGGLMAHRPDLKVVANREAERFLGRDLIIPVDIDARDHVHGARETRAGMLAHLEAGGALLVFGSGRVPFMQDGRLVEPHWRTGITRMSAAAGAPIIPASANMRNSRHYYRTRTMVRSLSGGNDDLGRAVASLRYVSELLAKLGGTYEVHYGAPLPPGTTPEVLKEAAEGLVAGLYR